MCCRHPGRHSLEDLVLFLILHPPPRGSPAFREACYWSQLESSTPELTGGPSHSPADGPGQVAGGEGSSQVSERQS